MPLLSFHLLATIPGAPDPEGSKLMVSSEMSSLLVDVKPDLFASFVIPGHLEALEDLRERYHF